ncbi:hypothetical protein T11_357 [Trichinella zimbabwensis]|uniref:Uncharacterized protein n=1 Tax=Trichinella zimbabwensis TaxID=268475 RepID=A0A0V1GNX7_9BILA|nr:hypothetical protein T11_357 [Trichinella zimbabwensis]
MDIAFAFLTLACALFSLCSIDSVFLIPMCNLPTLNDAMCESGEQYA